MPLVLPPLDPEVDEPVLEDVELLVELDVLDEELVLVVTLPVLVVLVETPPVEVLEEELDEDELEEEELLDEEVLVETDPLDVDVELDVETSPVLVETPPVDVDT